jgi:putative thioredoxin
MNTPTASSTTAVPVSRVFDATLETFEQNVLRRADGVPVLIDFWATWCAPCKALGPILEKLAGEYGGAFLLAKVDIDREPELAQHFQIRSVPTVMLLKEGRIVSGFPGALPESQVRRFLSEHGVEPGSAAVNVEPVDPATEMHRLRAAAAAAPDDAELKLALALALVGAGDYDEAEGILDALPANLGTDARTARARARIGLARVADGAPSRTDLEAALAANPDDHRARHLLGVRLVMTEDPAAGLEHLLELLRRDRNYAEGLPRRALVDAFSVVDDEALVRATRRRMTALLF